MHVFQASWFETLVDKKFKYKHQLQLRGNLASAIGNQIFLLRSKYPISRISQTRHDVTVVI